MGNSVQIVDSHPTREGLFKTVLSKEVQSGRIHLHWIVCNWDVHFAKSIHDVYR